MNNFKLRRKVDVSIPTVGIILSLFGLVMVFSASQITAATNYGNQYYFFIRQLVFWLLGMGAFFYFLRIPLDKLYQQRGAYLITTVILLLAVLVIGRSIGGGHRWIGFGSFQFQPSEFAKLFLVIYFAGWLAAKGDALTQLKTGLLPFVLLLFFLAGLIALEHDSGTMLVIVGLIMAMLFVARIRLWQYIGLLILLIAAVTTLVYATPYQRARLTTLFAQKNNSADTLGSAYQIEQSKIAIGSGGAWGVGFGQGISKYAYLPQVYTDSIFAIIAQELGFVRTGLFLIAYIYLAWRGLMIAQRANSQFVQLLAIGISTALIVQTFINIGGMIGILPLTGVPLPFVSYGGSSLIVSLAMLGLLTNASRETTD